MATYYLYITLIMSLFLRASERRVLLKVGVCYISLHAHIFIIFSSSHLHIFTSSHLHIFTHLHTSSHIFTHLLTLAPSVTVSLLLFLFSLTAAGSTDEAPQHGHHFARNEVRVSKIEVFCDFGNNPFALCVKASVCESVCL